MIWRSTLATQIDAKTMPELLGEPGESRGPFYHFFGAILKTPNDELTFTPRPRYRRFFVRGKNCLKLRTKHSPIHHGAPRTRTMQRRHNNHVDLSKIMVLCEDQLETGRDKNTIAGNSHSWGRRLKIIKPQQSSSAPLRISGPRQLLSIIVNHHQ